MHQQSETPRNITAIALVVELGLGLAAIVVGWLIGSWPLQTVVFDERFLSALASALVFGCLATMPLAVMLLVIQYLNFGPFGRLNRVVDQLLVPLFSGTSTVELAMISVAAGIGEELLFRGLIQATIANSYGEPYGWWIGLLIASVVFGVCHWITTTYAVLATAIGLYLGWLFVATDNLLVPMVTHGLYDFVALVYLAKWKGRRIQMTSAD